MEINSGAILSSAERLFYLSIASYALTFVMVSSSLLQSVREWIRRKTLWLQPKGSNHPIECRMCFGFWASLAVCLVYGALSDVLVVYGLSYFLATQER